MKTILAFLLLPLALVASEVCFGWLANTEANLAGYRLYQGPSHRVYTNVVVIPANATNYWMEVNLGFGETNYFALSAFDTDALESELTQDLLWTPSQQYVQVISERTFDGVLWHAAITNLVATEWPAEFWRLRIER